MPMPFSNTTTVKQGADAKFILYQKTGPFNYFLSYFSMFLSFPKGSVESRKLRD